MTTTTTSTSFDAAITRAAARGFVVGARVMANGDFPATIVDVTDRGIAVSLDDGGTVFLARGGFGFDRTVTV